VPLSKVSLSPPIADMGSAQPSLCRPQSRRLVISASRVTPTRKCEFSLHLSPGFDRGGASADGAGLTLGARASCPPVHCCFASGRPIRGVDRTLLTISREKSGTEKSQARDNDPGGPPPTRYLGNEPKLVSYLL